MRVFMERIYHFFLPMDTSFFDANHYLVVSVPLPFECETEGSPEKPLLAVKIGVTPAAVTELLMQMEQLQPANGAQPQVMEVRFNFRPLTRLLLHTLASAASWP